MKLAQMYRNRHFEVKDKDGDPTFFPVFRWWSFNRHPSGWALDILAFLSAVTVDGQLWQFTGVISMGTVDGDFYLRLCPNQKLYWIIGGKYA